MPARIGQAGLQRLKRLPCTRFYLENRGDTFNEYISGMMGSEGGMREAMLRTQQTLVISPVSSRWYIHSSSSFKKLSAFL